MNEQDTHTYELCHDKICAGFAIRSNTNRAVQSQNIVRSLKFRIYDVEALHYLCSENKGADVCVYRAADLRFCFHICKKQVIS